MKNKYNILYCIPSLAQTGGTEKILCSKANYFADILEFEVTILISEQKKMPISFPISSKVNIIDLNITKYTSNKIKGLSFINNIKKLKKVYEKEINRIHPDLIIVLERGYEDFIIPYIAKGIYKIREYHSSKNASLSFEKKLPPLKRIKAITIRKLYHNQFSKYDSLVVLTDKDSLCWRNNKSISVIPNIVEKNGFSVNDILGRPKKIISVGSMFEDRKGFSILINVWSKLAEEYKEWSLHIYGDGPYKAIYQRQINNLNLQNNVFLEGIYENIYEKYQESQLFLFTSNGEGLPLVLLEAQQNGLPVVSYDCYCGPSDIIIDNKGGFLIQMNNENSFAEKVKLLINDDNLRYIMSKEAISNAERYSHESIMPLWINLFDKLISNK
jgi:glycosyltransferase involved in cell wall biosynthesis